MSQRQPTPAPGTIRASDADRTRFLRYFEGRPDAYATMWRRGNTVGYSPVHSPLNVERIAEHLAGRITVGSYLVGPDQRCGLLCFDFDLDPRARAASARSPDEATRLWNRLVSATEHLAAALRSLQLDPLVEYSGSKGLHLWLLLPERRPAAEVRGFAHALLQRTGAPPTGVSIEVFPKQDSVPHGKLGNLVKLPLGVHLGTGRRALLLDDAGQPHRDPFARLAHYQRRALPRAVSHAVQPFPGGQHQTASHDAPLPPVEPKTWSEGDFDTSPSIAPLLRGCPVLKGLVEQALSQRELDRASAVVLEHTLGHTPDGPQAVNYLLDAVPGTERLPRMGAPHSGSPISCKRVRQRVPELANRVGCRCGLVPDPGGYAHPLLYLRDAPAEGGDRYAEAPLEEVLLTLARTEDRLRTVEAEALTLRERAIELLSQRGERSCVVPGGRWQLRGRFPALSLVFEPGDKPSPDDDSRDR